MHYLQPPGLPLDASNRDLLVWNPVIERVEKWLEGWQKRYFVLIKGTLSSIPTYFMLLCQTPIIITERWKDFSGTSYGMRQTKQGSFISSSTCNDSEEMGGLRVKNQRVFNKALLGKWIWRFRIEENALWRG